MYREWELWGDIIKPIIMILILIAVLGVGLWGFSKSINTPPPPSTARIENGIFITSYNDAIDISQVRTVDGLNVYFISNQSSWAFHVDLPPQDKGLFIKTWIDYKGVE
jgi:hypothetical protein